MTALGVGIIGCGNISTTYLRLAPLFKTFRVRAVADLNIDAARTRAEEHGVEARSVDDLLVSDDIDIVVNLTVPTAHFDVTRTILEAGKHVYSEKPFVLSTEEGAQLRALAQTQGLRIGSAPDTFLGGAHQIARHLIDDGKAGQITSGTAHIMSRGMEHWHPNPDFFFKPGGGPMLDMGPYYLTNLIQLLGPVARVAALTSAAFEERMITSPERAGQAIMVETPTSIHALLEFHSGASVTLSTSWDVQAHRHGHMELYGTQGSLFLPDPNFFGDPVEWHVPGGKVMILDGETHPLGRPNQDGRANYRGAGLADMAAALIDGREHRCALDLSLHVVDVMTSILRSGEERAFVKMSTTCTRPAPLNSSHASALLA
ncbi:MAG: Gfo/Idh/MocA family oxidoreductase [Pseudomonadota bacterium]